MHFAQFASSRFEGLSPNPYFVDFGSNISISSIRQDRPAGCNNLTARRQAAPLIGLKACCVSSHDSQALRGHVDRCAPILLLHKRSIRSLCVMSGLLLFKTCILYGPAEQAAIKTFPPWLTSFTDLVLRREARSHRLMHNVRL